ncbi:MAG: helix-turn-helix domain-containing protein [Chloroflexi bacterium]|nr:helix-turn-helix domain-containing protein [Chloroflexota bacterium]
MALTPTQIRAETRRRAVRLSHQLGDDIRRMRLDGNLPVTAIERATGIDDAYLARIEAGTARPSLEVLVAIGLALGADLSLRYFAGALPRIHDRFQTPMLEALLRVLHPRWRCELEVPVGRPARGVIDSVLSDRSSPLSIATEVQSEIRRVEEQVRWSREKSDMLAARLAEESADGSRARTVSRLLVLRSTVRTRELARQLPELFRAAFPTRTVDVFAALTGEAPWPGPGLIWVDLHGSRGSVMRFPPRGVMVGR